jgi:iron complex outermembrane receptor protein
MVTNRKLNLIGSLICLLSISIFLISAQEQSEKKQEVTEEFFYSEEVEIASLKPQSVEEAPGIVSVITAQQIKDMGARDLNDVLKSVPGFQFAVPSPQFYAETYIVRGLKQTHNTRILVMMDGVPLNDAYYGQSFLNWGDMSLNNVKRIEIIRGPGSALYGTYAFLAVVNIITNKPEDIGGIELSAGGGSWNTKQYYILAGKRFGDFSLSGYVDYRKSDGYDNYQIEQDLVSFIYSQIPFLPSVSMAPGKISVPLDSTRADLRMTYKDLEFQFKIQDYERGSPLGGFSITDGFWEEHKSHIAHAIYKRNISDKLSLTFKGNYYYRQYYINGQAYPKGMYGPLMGGLQAQGFFTNGLLGEARFKEHSAGLQSLFDYQVNPENMFTFGIEYTYLRTDKPDARANVDPITRMQSNQLHDFKASGFGFMEQDADRKVAAALIQDTFQLGDSLNITMGLRIDHYSEFGNAVNPRLSVVWKAMDKTNIKLLYGHAFRAPTFSELYMLHRSQVGNENLGPEKVRSFEVGINHKLTSKVNLNINYFYNSLTDVILPTGKIVFEGSSPQLENSGKVNAQGIEAEFKVNLEKNTSAYFNYSYAKAKDELTDEIIPNVANNLFNFGINIGYWKYLNANLNVNYVGERKRGLLSGFPDPRDPLNTYSLFDLTLRGQNFWKNTEVILTIHNLANTEYRDPEELGLIYYDLPREGRQILGKVVFKF